MTELTNWERWQLERFGDILPIPNMKISEPGEDELNRFDLWMQIQTEKELWEHEFKEY